MKKVLSIVLVVAMMLSTMMLTANATSFGTRITSFDQIKVGGLYVADGNELKYVIESNDCVIPGSNIYMILATYTDYTAGSATYLRKDYTVKKATIAPDTDSRNVVAKASTGALKTLKYVSTSNLKIGSDQIKVGTSETKTLSYRCVEIPVKAINVTKNDFTDSFNCTGSVNVAYSDRNDDSFDFNFEAMYDTSETLSEDYTTLVHYDSQDDIDITDDEDMIEIEATATGEAVSRLTVDYDIIDEIDEIYGDYASLEYLKVTGSLTRVKNCTVRIFADGSRYLYKYEDGVLVDLSSYYNSSEDAFVMKQSGTTINFGTYVISDVKLSSAKAPASTTTTTTTTGTTVKPVVPTTPGSTVKPVIPNTGVALELQ